MIDMRNAIVVTGGVLSTDILRLLKAFELTYQSPPEPWFLDDVNTKKLRQQPEGYAGYQAKRGKGKYRDRY